MLNKADAIAAITQHQAVPAEETPITAAVLLLLMYDKNENLFIIVTKRPDSIATYAGDYCLPGGMRDQPDTSLQITVEREIDEELSLTSKQYQFIGQLDDSHDRHGNLVRPFVAIISKSDFEQNVKHSPIEVAEIYYFPLSHLSKIEPNPLLEQLTKRSPIYSYTDKDVFIWGLTARILFQLHETLLNFKQL